MNPIFIVILIVFTSSFIYSVFNPKSAEENTTQTSSNIAELGVIYVGMPKEDLAKAGYAELMQKDYRKEKNEEWITFSNWTTEEPDDAVTFYIVDGKVKEWKEK